MSRDAITIFFAMRGSRNLCQRGREGEARLPKNNRNNIIFNPQLILQFYRGGGGSSIFGVQLFPGGGGGGPDAYFHKNAYNL